MEVIRPKVSTYEEAIEKAAEYLRQRYGRVTVAKVERVFMQPHYEDSLWVVDVIAEAKTKPIPIKKKRIKARVLIDPLSGDARAT